MKKIFITLLSFFFLVYSPCIQSSQEDFQRRAQAALKKLSAEDQAKIADITLRAQAGEQLSFDDIDFLQNLDPKIIKIMKEDKEAEEAEEAKSLEQSKKQAQTEKDKNKNKLAKFESEPLGQCPFDENEDTGKIEILNGIINLDEERAAHDINHRDLKTTLACEDSVYNLQSIATSPHNNLISFVDGTTLYLSFFGDKILEPFRAKTTPENEYHIQATQSKTNADELNLSIKGYKVCANIDNEKQPHHNHLTKIIYKKIEPTQEKVSPSSQLSVKGRRYSGLSTWCCDAETHITATKKQLAYLIKKKQNSSTQERSSTPESSFTPQRSWTDFSQATVNYIFPGMTDEEKAEELAADLQALADQEKIDAEIKKWGEGRERIVANVIKNAIKEVQYYGSFFSWQTAATSNNTGEQNNVASARKTDLQKIQEKEVNRAS